MSRSGRTADLVAPTGASVEILKGRTRFPHRPVRGDRFLIGGGSQCDLQLGGDDVPMLHSLIVLDGAEATIEAVSPHPRLLVNGETVRTAVLKHGDRVEVGKVAFAFHHDVVHVKASPNEAPPIVSNNLTSFPSSEDLAGLEPDVQQSGDLSEVSARDLIERIESEEQFIADDERARRMGAMSLLDAVRRAVPSTLVTEPSAAESTSGPETVEGLAVPAADLVLREQEVLEREQRLSAYEATLKAHAEALAAVQDRLALQIEAFRGQMQIPEQHDHTPLRISA